MDFWRQRKPTWDPSRVSASTLVIVGEWDENTPIDMARQVHERLIHAATRELRIWRRTLWRLQESAPLDRAWKRSTCT